MKDIHEVLRQKQAKYAQLGKQIEMLQQAAEKLREVAPLLAENDDEDNAVLAEVDDATGNQTPWRRRPGQILAISFRFQGGASGSASLAVIVDQANGRADRLMTLQALLVSTDDSAADVLGRVLPSSASPWTARAIRKPRMARIQQQKFDALIVDYDDAEGGGRCAATGAEAGIRHR